MAPTFWQTMQKCPFQIHNIIIFILILITYTLEGNFSNSTLKFFLYQLAAFEIHPKVDNFQFPSKYSVNLIWYTFKPFKALAVYGRGHGPLF